MHSASKNARRSHTKLFSILWPLRVACLFERPYSYCVASIGRSGWGGARSGGVISFGILDVRNQEARTVKRVATAVVLMARFFESGRLGAMKAGRRGIPTTLGGSFFRPRCGRNRRASGDSGACGFLLFDNLTDEPGACDDRSPIGRPSGRDSDRTALPACRPRP